MKKVVALVLALSTVMMFAVAFAEVATPTTVEPITVPVEEANIVASSDRTKVIINGIEYTYFAFSEQAKWSTPTSPVFWGRVYKNDAYLFSMVTGAFIGKYELKDLSYVDFATVQYMNSIFVPFVKSV